VPHHLLGQECVKGWHYPRNGFDKPDTRIQLNKGNVHLHLGENISQK
jgi:hypothetical protein